MPCTKTVSTRLSVRLHKDKLDLAKTLRLEDGRCQLCESFGSKLAGADLVTLTQCVLTSYLRLVSRGISSTQWEQWKGRSEWVRVKGKGEQSSRENETCLVLIFSGGAGAGRKGN